MLKIFSNKNFIKNIIILVSVCILTIIPFFNIVLNGVYSWHIRQPQFYQGGTEIIAFIILSCIFSIKFRDRFEIFLLVLSCIYLSLNAVIIPVVVVYIYFDIICYIGNTVLSLNKDTNSNDVIDNFISGVSIWGSISIIFSVLKFGTINNLRLVTLLILITSIILDKHKSYKLLIVHFYDFIRINKNSNKMNFLIIILIFFICMLFAKTNSAIDYDSLWYGLRPENVLVGKNSFYDNLGYSAFVYYYPKLMELLFLPISGMGDYSFIICSNILVFILFISSFYKLGKLYFKCVKSEFIILFTIITFSIPAISNIATTAKPDILGSFFTFLSFYYFLKYISDKETKNIIFSFLGIMLSTGTKLTYMLWAGLLFISIILSLLINKNKIKTRKRLRFNRYYLILCLGIIFVGGVHYRTYKLTGYPVYPILMNIFNLLGFKAKYPAISERTSTLNQPICLSEVFDRLYQFIFDPQNLSHVIMQWTSTLVPILLIVLILYIRANDIKINQTLKIVLIIAIPQISAMIYYMCSMDNPDGNYFILPIVIISFITMYMILQVYNYGKNYIYSKCIILCSVLILIMNLTITFVSHSSWEIGTREFDLEVIKNNFETFDKNQNSYKKNGYSKIANYIRENMKEKRILSSYKDFTELYRIDGAIETYYEISFDRFSNKTITSSYNDFINYIKYSNIRGLMLIHDDQSQFKEYINCLIKQYGYINKIEDEKATFYEIEDLNSISSNFKNNKLLEGKLYSDGWVSKDIKLKMYTVNGKLNIKGYTDNNIIPNAIKIYINNDEIYSGKIKNKEFYLNIDTEIKNEIVDIRIVFDKAIIPKNIGINEDSREIACILKELYFK